MSGFGLLFRLFKAALFGPVARPTQRPMTSQYSGRVVVVVVVAPAVVPIVAQVAVVAVAAAVVVVVVVVVLVIVVVAVVVVVFVVFVVAFAVRSHGHRRSSGGGCSSFWLQSVWTARLNSATTPQQT